MTARLRNTLLSARDLLATAGPFMLLALGLLAIAYWMLDPQPPRRVVLATGQPQGAYAQFGERYRQVLAQNGITVELRETAGAAENLKLLGDPNSGVDLAFVQGGAADTSTAAEEDDDDAPLLSLGSLFYEPVWLFYRRDAAQRLIHSSELHSLSQLTGWHVSIGARGSGIPNLMLRLLDANHIDPSSLKLERLAQTPSVVDLVEGRIDALVFVSAPESLMVQMLLQTPGIGLYDFPQAEAYARRFHFLSTTTLPRGVVDIAADVPPHDVHLVAPTATLVARRTTHPALMELFVLAAQQIHGGAGWFHKKGEFPNTQNTSRPLAKEAQRIYQNGPPLLQRYLPFWLANLVDRMWPVVAAMIALLIPLSRAVPPLYQFRIRSRVFRWYGQLRELEERIDTQPADALLDELHRIDGLVADVKVPLSYADELYALRAHIRMIEARLRGGAGAPDPVDLAAAAGHRRASA
ncbi:MAG TPA: TAXI family TRAP transporter solute-binding subunit [Caldimonas sp.]|nr:TAXI family TRAP transporter solute-binding subunit [Caldimonas sp.]